MLEIYNETIRDLLSTNRYCTDASRTENGVAGKQYAIKHDTNGNTYVSDLTIVDVRSTREVSYLLDQAAQSRHVFKICTFYCCHGHSALSLEKSISSHVLHALSLV